MDESLAILLKEALNDGTHAAETTRLLESWLSDLGDLSAIKPSRLRFLTSLLDFHGGERIYSQRLTEARTSLQRYAETLNRRGETGAIVSLTDHLCKFWVHSQDDEPDTLNAIVSQTLTLVEAKATIILGIVWNADAQARNYLKFAISRHLLSTLELLVITQPSRIEMKDNGGSLWPKV